MKYFFLTVCIAILCVVSPSSLFAAKMVFQADTQAPANGQPLVVRVYVDPEGTPLSSLGGVLSFSSDLFALGDITTQSSIVSVWVTHPKVSKERYLDSRTRVVFEGLMPGGFSGVRSPYYEGVRAGVVFTITLWPKTRGQDTILLDSVELHAFDESGSIIDTSVYSQEITVPELSTTHTPPEKPEVYVTSPTLAVSLARDPLIESNAWYLTVQEDESIRPINHIEIAESNDYSPEHVSSYMWHAMTNPYILVSQSRSKYIHVKVFYEDGSYTLHTLPPVENSANYPYLSRILIFIVILLLVAYSYGKNSSRSLARSRK